MTENQETERTSSKTRTSITITPALLDALRDHCVVQGTSVSAFIERAVREALSAQGVNVP